jgi:alkaline phosphatase
MKIRVLFFLMAAIAMSVAACSQAVLYGPSYGVPAPAEAAPAASPYSGPAKSVIFFIGDGMGPEILTIGTEYSQKVRGQDLNMVKLANSGRAGFMTTYSANKLVTDSAAGVTALATGYKTNNGMVDVLPDTTRLVNLFERAMAKGKSVGVITTTSVTDATPAGFLAHSASRYEEVGIAAQIVSGGATVVMGGGRKYFTGEGDKDLIAKARSKGFEVVFDKEDLRAGEGDRVLGLFAEDDMPYEGERVAYETPSLADMFDAAMRRLTGDPDGFVLVVEGGLIDHAEHGNMLGAALDELFAMDDALGHAMDYQRSDSTVTIVVSADHDTGGPAFTVNQRAYPPADDMEGLVREGTYVRWLSGDHTSTMVPLLACGPGEALFSGIRDNTYVYRAIVAALGL